MRVVQTGRRVRAPFRLVQHAVLLVRERLNQPFEPTLG